MISTKPVESYGELAQRFPGIDESEPQALGRFAFHAAKHMPSEAFEYRENGEKAQDWHEEVGGVLDRVRYWIDGRGDQHRSRLEMAQRIAQRALKEQEMQHLRDALASASASEGYKLAKDFIEAGGYQIETEMAPSPLFPEGRTSRADIELYEDPDTGYTSFQVPYKANIVNSDGDRLDTDIAEYVEKGHRDIQSGEKITATLEALEPIDKAEFEELRAKYGAKAAGLMCFDKRVRHLRLQLKYTNNTIDVTIPPFTAVASDMYEAWLNGSPDYADSLEQARLEAVGFEKDLHGNSADMVAIRSSAIKSEDGDEHTGAGVYRSVAVDPRDPAAFRLAVEEVYASTRSEAALSYQASIGVTDELMGLVIQRYQETSATGLGRDKSFYGHANSTGANLNIVEVNTNEGDLHYDKNALLAQFMMIERSSGYSSELLHSYPDHYTSLKDAVQQTSVVPHAVVLAEKLFGKPMQVEFVNDAIVQVRPLQVAKIGGEVSFPEEQAPIGECAASGIGDMELEGLDERNDNSNKKGFIVFWHEYGYTISGNNAGYNSFPEEGAVIVMTPSNSGHIQAICREKGLLCFYPKKGATIDHLEKYVWADEELGKEPDPVKLRFVADGYDGKIYEI